MPKLLATLVPLAATFTLAGLPVLIVVQDRWLGQPTLVQPLDGLSQPALLFNRLALPAYFLPIYVCTALFLALFWLWYWRPDIQLTKSVEGPHWRDPSSMGGRQIRIARGLVGGAALGSVGVLGAALMGGREPGWGLVGLIGVYGLGWVLAEYPIQAISAAVRRRRLALIGGALWFVTLIIVLRHTLGGFPMPLVMSVPFGLALVGLAYLARWVRPSPLFWIVSLSLVVSTLGIGAWWFAVVGDEHIFWSYAREIIEQHSLTEIGDRFFRGRAVYEAHPYFSSLLQAGWMTLMGVDNFGWRTSSLYLNALSLPLFYSFFDTFVQRRVALLITLGLGVSSYLIAFGRVGYNNLQAFWALGLVLAAAAWAVRSDRRVAYVMTGLSMGLCFYLYPGAFYAVPLPVLLLLFFAPPTGRHRLARWLWLGLSALLVVWPLLLQPDYWLIKREGTLLNNAEIMVSPGRVAFHFFSNSLYSLFSPLYVYEESHFVAAGYLDPLSSVFILFGLAYLLTRLTRDRFAAFLMLSFVLLIYGVGASHDRLFPSNTRMFMLLPWWAAMAGLGLVWVIDTLGAAGLKPALSRVLGGLLVVGIIGLNVYQSTWLYRVRSDRYQSLETVHLRTVERIFTHDRVAHERVLYWINNPTTFSLKAQRDVIGLYPIPVSRAQLSEIVAAGPTLTPTERGALQDPKALVIVSPRLPDQQREALMEEVRRLGKQPCEIKNDGGHVHFTLWLPLEMADRCESLQT